MDETLTRLGTAPQYSVPAREKRPALVAGLNALTALHRERCLPYARMLHALGVDGAAAALADVPALPVGLFKSLELSSVPPEAVFKVMTSSGTTGQVPSRIVLDVETAQQQTRALSSIVTHYLGARRLPMLIVDHAGVIKDRRQFSARAAGILGMLNFGRDHLYLLDDDMRLDRAALDAWLEAHAGEDLLIFGFTFMVWQDLLTPLLGEHVDLSKATLVHSGGWKKLTDRAVSADAFKAKLLEELGIARVHNFYGMVEQVGSVFFECPEGFFHPPNLGDVMIRDERTWQLAPDGQPGLVQVMSLLPRSYPGHSLLTEDLGVVHGEDDCRCGRMGKWFEVLGRVPRAEVRGCSDTQVRAA